MVEDDPHAGWCGKPRSGRRAQGGWFPCFILRSNLTIRGGNPDPMREAKMDDDLPKPVGQPELKARLRVANAS